MTSTYFIVQTHGCGYSYSESNTFLHELKEKFPEAIVDDSQIRRDFNIYVVKTPSKAMANRIMWELGRTKSHSTYWARKFHRIIDDETGEEVKMFAYFAYKLPSERK